MQRHVWSKLLCTGLLFASFSVPVLGQNQPAQTYQPGYWQPIARVNPKSPVTVMLVNQTEMPLKYNFLDDRAEANLRVGDRVNFKNVTLPLNIAVYDPSPKAAAGEEVNLDYTVTVQNNMVTIYVQPVKDEGHRVVNVARSGAVYLY